MQPITATDAHSPLTILQSNNIYVSFVRFQQCKGRFVFCGSMSMYHHNAQHGDVWLSSRFFDGCRAHSCLAIRDLKDFLV